MQNNVQLLTMFKRTEDSMEVYETFQYEHNYPSHHTNSAAATNQCISAITNDICAKLKMIKLETINTKYSSVTDYQQSFNLKIFTHKTAQLV